MDDITATKDSFGLLWARNKYVPPVDKFHFDVMQRVVGEPIVRGAKGIDVGSGCGFDTYIMAKNHPSVEIVSIDLSDGIYRTKALTSGLNNVRVVKCSILDAPLRDGIFDFAYSFGVLHHTADPKRGLLEIARILKKGSPAFLYLYQDHSDNFVKCLAVRAISKLRNVTIKVPAKIIYALSWFCSPIIFMIFTIPAKALNIFKATRQFSRQMPFNFATGPFSLIGDLYDRFHTPIEYRFSRKQVHDLFSECGFYKIQIAQLQNTAGWVAWGYKG